MPVSLDESHLCCIDEEITKYKNECQSEDHLELIKYVLPQMLTQFFPQSSKNRREITQCIKSILAILGSKLEYKVYTNGLPCCISKKYNFVNREWMYDLIWYNDLETCKYCISEFNLAVESELSGKRNKKERKSDDDDPIGAVKYDFQKLLVGTAVNNVMIFKASQQNDNKWESYIDYFQTAINTYVKDKNQRFLIIMLNQNYTFNSETVCILKKNRSYENKTLFFIGSTKSCHKFVCK